MHLLLFNLRMDLDDPVLGFASRWVDAIAERVDRVTVVTMSAGRVEAPDNVTVHSVGKERGWSEPRRAAAFYEHCLRLMRTAQPDACFSHMIPVFSVLFAPLARAYRIPTLLWYAHGAVPIELRVAERLVDRCVTSTPEGFRLPSGKLHVLQQGIDVARLVPPEPPSPQWASTIVCVGRIGPVKRLIESVEAVALLRQAGVPVAFEIIGAPATAEDEHYERRVRARVQELGLGEAVAWRGRIPFDAIADAYRRGAILLNLSRSGSLDKVILESMACGCIPVSNNDAFAAIARARGWDEIVPGASVEDAAETLRRTLAMSLERQRMLRVEMREFVSREHGLDGLVDRIVAHLGELTRRRRRVKALA
jgi:glycosyltransferase involved in cell wall biosynthesis